MTLRRKTLVVVALTFIGMTAGLHLAISGILSKGFRKLEGRDMELTMKRVQEAILGELADLAATARRLAEWDEAYAFVRDMNSAFATNRLVDSEFARDRLNLQVWADVTGRIAFRKAFDWEKEVGMPLPPLVSDWLEANPQNWQTLSRTDVTNRLMLPLPEGLFMMVARPILPSKGKGSSRGTLVLGRYLDPELVRRAAQVSELQLQAFRASDAAMPEDVREASAGITAGAPVVLEPDGPDRMLGYARLPGIHRSVDGVLRVEIPRAIHLQERRTLDYLLISLLLAGVTLCGVTLLLLDRLVLVRLGRLGRGVSRIGATGDASARVAVQGRDELARLAGDINGMLKALHEAQAALRKAHDELEDRVQERTSELNQSNELLRAEIVEREKVEVALRQSEELFSKAFRASPVSISLSSYPEGRLLDVNDAFLKMFGYDRDEVLGLTVLELGLWVDPEERKALMGLLERDRVVRDFECRFKARDGALRHTLVSVELIQVGTQSCMLFLRFDLTERLNLEAQLRHSQKMEAVGQMAASVAHDFNNMLTVIRGHTSLLLSQKSDENRLAESLGQVSAAAERATNLTRQLLTFSRKQVLQPKVLSLNEVISNISKMVTRVVGEGVVLQFNYTPNLPAVRADAGMIEQVIMNLAVNARDAMPQGGRLAVSTELVEVSAEMAQRCHDGRAGRFVRVSFSDSGCGMDAATLSRIFEPFFTTKGPGKGTGLGLATVYGIVKQHQGWVDVTSEPGKGTTFHIHLPGLPKPASASSGPPDEEVIRGGTETVMVVEDEDDVRELIRGILERYGYRVLVAGSAGEAMKLWHSDGSSVDLLLTDNVLPNQPSGRELASTMQHDRPGLRILYTSGYSAEAVTRDLSQREGKNFLQKPFSVEALVRAVRRCLDVARR